MAIEELEELEVPYQMIYTLFTPAIAAGLLPTQERNRQISQAHITKLVRDMLSGRWHETNHQPIALSADWRLLDGQHRLTAVVRSGVSIKMWVAIGVDRKVVEDGTDKGAERRLKDQLWFSNDRVSRRLIKNLPTRARDLAGMVGFIYYAITTERGPGLRCALRIIKHYRPSVTWAMENLTSNSVTRRVAVVASLILVHHWAAQEGEEALDRMEEIAQGLKSGENIGGAALNLREYIRSQEVQSNRHQRGDSDWVIFHKCLRALQAAVNFEPLQKIRMPNATRIRTWVLRKSPHAKEKELKLVTLRSVKSMMSKKSKG